MNIGKFSDEFIASTSRLSKSIGVDPETIIEAVFLRYLAEKNARQQVWGPHDDLCPEFMADQDGKYLKGRELYQLLEGTFKHQFKQERLQELEAREKAGLNDEEREWFEDHRPQITPAEAREIRKELREKGLLGGGWEGFDEKKTLEDMKRKRK